MSDRSRDSFPRNPLSLLLVCFAGWKNLSDAADGFLLGCRFLIQDRSTRFTEQFRETLRSAGVESLKLPPRSPNLNA